MSDYKEEIFVIAEEIAMEEHDCEYYDLSSDQQYHVWRQAEEQWAERQTSIADGTRGQ